MQAEINFQRRADSQRGLSIGTDRIRSLRRVLIVLSENLNEFLLYINLLCAFLHPTYVFSKAILGNQLTLFEYAFSYTDHGALDYQKINTLNTKRIIQTRPSSRLWLYWYKTNPPKPSSG